MNIQFEEQLSPSLNSVANVSERSPGNGTNGIERETGDRESYVSIGFESDWLTNASDSVSETKPTDSTAAGNDVALNATPPKIESDTIITLNTYDTYDSDDG